jgi:hypothetical protein
VACGSSGCRHIRSNAVSNCAKIASAEITKATNPMGPLAGAFSFTVSSVFSTCCAKSGDAWCAIVEINSCWAS